MAEHAPWFFSDRVVVHARHRLSASREIVTTRHHQRMVLGKETTWKLRLDVHQVHLGLISPQTPWEHDMPLMIFHILPNTGGGWSVKKQGAKRASSTFVTKTLALRAASRMAKAYAEAQVVIHNAAGKIVGDRHFTISSHRKNRVIKERVRKMRKTLSRNQRRAQRLRAKRRIAAKKGLRRQRQVQLARSHAARRAANRRQ
jgi:hypothetical protein